MARKFYNIGKYKVDFGEESALIPGDTYADKAQQLINKINPGLADADAENLIQQAGGRVVSDYLPIERTARTIADTNIGTGTDDDLEESMRKNVQSQVDAINQIYNSMIANVQREGTQALGSTKAAAGRRGLFGSPFYSAQKEQIKGKVKAKEEEINAQRVAQITGIQDKLDERLLQKEQMDREAALGNLELKIEWEDKIKTEAKEDVKNIALAGYSLDQFRNTDYYQQLLDETGMNKLALDSLYNANLPTSQQVKYQYIKADDGSIIRAGEDGSFQNMGKFEKPDESPEWKITTFDDGTTVWYNPSTMEIQPIGTFRKPESSGASKDEIDDWARSVLDRAANLYNVPLSMRTSVNAKMRDLREEGYTPQWMLERLQPTQIAQISEFDNTVATWEYVRQMANEMKDMLGPTKFSAYSGSFQDLAAQLKDPKFAGLKAEIDKAFQLYRKETTGAQASDKELQMLKPNLPQASDTAEAFFTKLENTIAGTKRARRYYLESFEKAAYDVSGFQEEETPAGENDPLGIR